MRPNSEQGLISAVICFYNPGNFLAEAIESVLSQSYPRWELVLVDDGSNDGSSDIARRYRDGYPSKISYVQHRDGSNHGLPSSRNVGISLSRGEYIALLDADDVWLPRKLEQQLQLLDGHPEASIAFAPCLYWYSWTGKDEDQGRDHLVSIELPPNETIYPPRIATMSYPLGWIATPCPSALFFRSSMATRIRGFEEAFDGKYAMLFEDQAFLAKVYLNEAVIMTDSVCAKYRRGHENCITARVERSGAYEEVALWYLAWLEKYLLRHHVSDPAIWDALEDTAWHYHHPTLRRMKRVAQRGVLALKNLVGVTGNYRRSTI